MAKSYKEKFRDEDGVWRTIGGRRVFIRKGQSLSDAMKESGKFKTKITEQEKQNIQKNSENKNSKTNTIPRNFDKITYTQKIETSAGKVGDKFELTKDEYGDYHTKNLRTGETYQANMSMMRSSEAVEINNIMKNNKEQQLSDIGDKEDKFYTRKDGTKEYDPYKGTRFEKKYDSMDDVINDPNSALNKYISEKETPMQEEERLENERIKSIKNEEKANRRLSKEYNKKQEENDRISKGMTKEEYKNGKYNFEYKDGMLTMKDKKGNELNSWGLSKENWEENKDYWKDKAVSEHKEEMYWLTKDVEEEFGENAEFNTDYLHKQKGYSYKQIENMSNEEYDRMFKDWKQEKSLKNRYKGTYEYLKETTNMSGNEILELLKKIEQDKK